MKRHNVAPSFLLLACGVCFAMCASTGESDAQDTPVTMLREETTTPGPLTKDVAVSRTVLMQEPDGLDGTSPTTPADVDAQAFAAFKKGREGAKARAKASDFAAADKACSARRNDAAKQCGEQYCKAKSVCGAGCVHKWGEPEKQVVPQQPGGPRFYKVQWGEGIELKNKELRDKEIKMKAAAAAERSNKKASFASAISEEKSVKQRSSQEMEDKEGQVKLNVRHEAIAKKNALRRELFMATSVSDAVCTAKSLEHYEGCEAERAHKAKLAADAEAQEKAEAKLAAANASLANATIAVDAATAEAEAQAGATTAEPAAPVNAPVNTTDGTSSSSADTSSCASLTALQCITAVGCHMEGSVCAAGAATVDDPCAKVAAESAQADAAVAAAEQCNDDDTWEDNQGNTCASSTVITRDWCAANGDKTFPGFACADDGSNCKPANDACCLCKVVSLEPPACADSESWKDDGTTTDAGSLTCASPEITDDWCDNHGAAIFPGHGCDVDGSNCFSANTACCTCKKRQEKLTCGAVVAATTVAEPFPTAAPTPAPGSDTSGSDNTTATEDCNAQPACVCSGVDSPYTHKGASCTPDEAHHSKQEWCYIHDGLCASQTASQGGDASKGYGFWSYDPCKPACATSSATTVSELFTDAMETSMTVSNAKLSHNKMDSAIIANLRQQGETQGYGDVSDDDYVPEESVPPMPPVDFSSNSIGRRLLAKWKNMGVSPQERATLAAGLAAARNTTAVIAAAALKQVKTAETAFVNATAVADEVKSAHSSNEGLANDVFGKSYKDSLSSKIMSVDSEIADHEAWTAAYNKHNGTHTCKEEKKMAFTECLTNQSYGIKTKVVAMKIKVHAEHIKYGDRAAQEAEDLGHALKLKMGAAEEVTVATQSSEKRVYASVDSEKQFIEPPLVDPYYDVAEKDSTTQDSTTTPDAASSTTPPADDAASAVAMPPEESPPAVTEDNAPPATEETAPPAGSDMSEAPPPTYDPEGSASTTVTASDSSAPPETVESGSTESAPPETPTSGSDTTDASSSGVPPVALLQIVQGDVSLKTGEEDDCEVAKEHAYSKCRVLQNEAYDACATLYFNAEFGVSTSAAPVSGPLHAGYGDADYSTSSSDHSAGYGDHSAGYGDHSAGYGGDHAGNGGAEISSADAPPDMDAPPPSDDAPPPTDDAPPSDESAPPADDTPPPTADDSSLPPDESAPPSDDSAPPSDDSAPPSDESAPPSDESAPPSDESAPPSDESAPPSDEAAPPSNEAAAPTVAPTAAPTAAPAPKDCTAAEVQGQEFYTWEPDRTKEAGWQSGTGTGGYCYHIVAGGVLERGQSREESKCNAEDFKLDLVIGRGQGVNNYYPNGDTRGCPRAHPHFLPLKKRETWLYFKSDPAVTTSSAVATEPSTCTYRIVVTLGQCHK